MSDCKTVIVVSLSYPYEGEQMLFVAEDMTAAGQGLEEYAKKNKLKLQKKKHGKHCHYKCGNADVVMSQQTVRLTQ